MAGIHVEIEGVSEAISALEKLKAKVTLATREATAKSGSVLQATAVAEFNHGDAPHTRTGNLQRSIRTWPVVQEGPARYRVQVNPTAIYSRIQELGGTITPKEKDFLSWIGVRADGTVGRIYKRSVTLRPRPYLRPATESMGPKMEIVYGTAWRSAWSV